MGTAEINQRSACGNEGSAMSQATAGDRGEEASHPGEIPKRGWKEVLLRVKDQVSSDNLSIVSAGVAFFALLAIFPGISALVTLYGLVTDPAQVEQQLPPCANCCRAMLPTSSRSRHAKSR